MKNSVVLDASALLALLNQEPGSKIVEAHLSHAMMSTVNFSEVISTLMHLGIVSEEAETITQELIDHVIPFDQTHAMLAAELKIATKDYGLSLGDRACLALAKLRNLPVLTADKAWTKLDIGIAVEMIR